MRKIRATYQVVVVSMVLAVTLATLPTAGASAFPGTDTLAETGVAGPEFVSSQVTDQRGDVVRITVRMPGSSSAKVQILGQRNDYEAKLTLRDSNNDGRVRLEFNTHLAGEGQAYWTADGGDHVSVRAQTDVDGLLPAGSYRLVTDDGSETAGLELERRSTDGVATMIAPDDAYERLRTTGAIDRYRSVGNLTTRPADDAAAVARHDTMVLRIRASGLSGVLAEQPGSNDTERFQALVDSDVLSFDVVETNPAPNQERASLLLNRNGLRVVDDGRKDRYYVVVDTSSAHYRRGEDGAVESGLPLGTRFEANLTVEADSKLGVDAPRTAESAIEIVERSAVLRSHAEAGAYFLRPAAGQFVEGATTIAPGSTIDVGIEATDADFSVRKSMTVGQADGSGSLEARVDLASLAEGASLSATARDHRGSLTADPLEVTVRSPAATLSNPGLEVEGSRLYATTKTNLSRGGLIAVRANNASGRLLGAAAVEPDQSSVQVPLENLPEKDTPLVVTALRDMDNDGVVSPSVDVPYEQSDSQRPVQVTVALYRLPPSPTPTPTSGPADTETTASHTETPSDDTAEPGDTSGSGDTTEPSTSTPPPGDEQLPVDVPGFGAAAALVALAAAFVLVARRE